MKKFGYTNPMQAPRITKITLNMGVGEAMPCRRRREVPEWPYRPPGQVGWRPKVVGRGDGAGADVDPFDQGVDVVEAVPEAAGDVHPR